MQFVILLQNDRFCGVKRVSNLLLTQLTGITLRLRMIRRDRVLLELIICEGELSGAGAPMSVESPLPEPVVAINRLHPPDSSFWLQKCRRNHCLHPNAHCALLMSTVGPT